MSDPTDGRTHYDGCWHDRRHHDCAVREIERLRRERDELRTDALRYRWLRDTSCPEHGDIYLASDSAWQSFRAGAVDAAIDAALLREEGR